MEKQLMTIEVAKDDSLTSKDHVLLYSSNLGCYYMVSLEDLFVNQNKKIEQMFSKLEDEMKSLEASDSQRNKALSDEISALSSSDSERDRKVQNMIENYKSSMDKVFEMVSKS